MAVRGGGVAERGEHAGSSKAGNAKDAPRSVRYQWNFCPIDDPLKDFAALDGERKPSGERRPTQARDPCTEIRSLKPVLNPIQYGYTWV